MKHFVLTAALLLASTEVRGQSYEPQDLCPFMADLASEIMEGRIQGVPEREFLAEVSGLTGEFGRMVRGVIYVAYSETAYEPADFALDVELGCYRGMLE
jgi:hypothetical protein